MMPDPFGAVELERDDKRFLLRTPDHRRRW
jgi:hypothetical protein